MPRKSVKPEPPKKGRPSKYRPELIPMARRMTEMGYTQIEIAEVFGTTPLSIRTWRSTYPEFNAAFSIALTEANAKVELSLFKMATGYWNEEEDIRIIENKIVRVPVKKWYPPVTSAAVFWSKVKMGWRDDVAEAPPETNTPTIDIESARQLARRVALVLHQGGRKESA